MTSVAKACGLRERWLWLEQWSGRFLEQLHLMVAVLGGNSNRRLFLVETVTAACC